MRKAPETVLLVDAGNTRVALGLAVGSRLLRRRLYMPTRGCGRSAIRAAIKGLAAGRRLDGGILACVAPSVSQQWMAEMSAAAGTVVAVRPGMKLDIEFDYPAIETLGADRMINASEAARTYGAPVIAADFGTAVTFDVVSKNKVFLGGVILPGWDLFGEYLAVKTERVPCVSAEEYRLFARKREPLSVGRNTKEAVCAGMFFGWRGMVKEIVSAIKRELKTRAVPVCITGGAASYVGAALDIPNVVVDATLTLRGLARAYQLNKPSSASGSAMR